MNPEPTDTDPAHCEAMADLERIPDPESQCPTPDADTQDDNDDSDERVRQLARELPGLGALVGVVREILEGRGERER